MPEDSPCRYVCSACHVCIATREGLLEIRDDVLLFRKLHVRDIENQGGRTISCPSCDKALGSRAESSFFLRKERVAEEQEPLEILVCGLKEREILDLAPILTKCFPHSNVTTRVLLKAELRGFRLQGHRPAPDFVVVVHRHEGRALLTDRNGFYHDVLGSAWQQTRGNVAVVLTRVEVQGEADVDLYDAKLVRSLSAQGDQPTVGAISSLGRLMTWECSPSTHQVMQLKKLTSRAYYREPHLESTEGLPQNWTAERKTSGRNLGHASSWCNVL